MPYRSNLLTVLSRQIVSWQLPDEVLVEVYLRLREALPQSPLQFLQREEQPFDGMVYRFSLVDPHNRIVVHYFAFHVLYGQDEETLYIVRGGYVKSSGV